MESKLVERIEEARGVTVIRSDEHVFQVVTEKHEYRVDLLSRECTCNNWGIDGFPCRHAIASIGDKGIPRENDGALKSRILFFPYCTISGDSFGTISAFSFGTRWWTVLSV
ncbi:hypothetical protein IFM89_021914 [Coptis chinensis]|uniref:SWIM-type domain-containing protein n=1 Tax=Coptis chinensis TaxID=261450 RepID=A0A835HG74_9MAGN|nr:hypothetical protein IFM89_021914 [Coptis chinensis]